MAIQIIAVGQKMPAWVEQGVADYARRFPRVQTVRLTEVPVAQRTTGQPVERLQRQEMERILRQRQPGSLLIAMDERGRQWSTREWGEHYRQWQQRHPNVDFVLGGPDGLHPELLAMAGLKLALGRMTLPHGLARVVLIEQLYRAWSLSQGHPYHRE